MRLIKELALELSGLLLIGILSAYLGFQACIYHETGAFLLVPTEEQLTFSQYEHAMAWDENMDWSKVPDFSKLSEWDRVQAINTWVDHAFPFVDTQTLYGKDYWEKPSEMLRVGGECRDYSTLKIRLLEMYGFKEKDIHLLAVYLPEMGAYHAIVVLQHEGHYYLLDSIQNLHDKILVDGNSWYIPLFWMNSSGVESFPDGKLPIPQT